MTALFFAAADAVKQVEQMFSVRLEYFKMPRASRQRALCPHLDATVHIEERGFQFADGVYEVIAVFGGCLIDVEEHLTD